MKIKQISFSFIIILISIINNANGKPWSIESIKNKDIKILEKQNIWNKNCENLRDRLKVVTVSYLGFDGKIHNDGKIIVLDVVSENTLNIFKKLLEIKFPIQRVGFIEKFDGIFSSGSFACRSTTSGERQSIHSFGLAIDINPSQNPYYNIDTQNKQIKNIVGDVFFINRSNIPNDKSRIGIITQDAIDIFYKNGFNDWGGYWNDFRVDYMHFQPSRVLSILLANATKEDGEKIFNIHLKTLGCLENNTKDIAEIFMEEYLKMEITSSSEKHLSLMYKENPSELISKIDEIHEKICQK